MNKNQLLNILCVFAFIIIATVCYGQHPKVYSASEIQMALKKSQVLGSALYIAAHPDDENTALIAYLANDRLIRTGYLSLTRGDGGQNLIGAEQRELLGLIRTQELLQARSIDGGEQFFSRANDFGFSKNPVETFDIWGHDRILADAVWVIRQFKPDILITRFPPTAEAGHGHHTASAMIAEEAFEAAGDPSRFPEQLKYVSVWQPKRMFWNAYSRSQGRFSNEPPDSLKEVSLKVELSSFNPLLGKPHTVMASESRSMHRSQGFGSARRREERYDILAKVKGQSASNDAFDGITLDWSRVKGAEQLSTLLSSASSRFKPDNPIIILDELLQAYQILKTLQDSDDENTRFWANFKQKEFEELIAACMGLWTEGNAADYSVAQGDNIKINCEIMEPYEVPVTIKEIKFFNQEGVITGNIETMEQPLTKNKLILKTIDFPISEDATVSQPYWLINNAEKGIFVVENQRQIGHAENIPALTAQFSFEVIVSGKTYTFNLNRAIRYKWTKPDEGELYRPFVITPKVMANVEDEILMFANDKPKTIKVVVKAGTSAAQGSLKLNLPDKWQSEPMEQSFELNEKYQEKTLEFSVTPPKESNEGILKIQTQINGKIQDAVGVKQIEYDHIPIQTLFPNAQIKLNRLNVTTKKQNLAYLEGAGDELPNCLTQIGYNVHILSEKDLKEDLKKYQTIIVGVRAFNLKDKRYSFYHQALLDYVSEGGTLVMQYHTPFEMEVDNLGPYPFKITRDRVTVEEAPITFLEPTHTLLNSPNKITSEDFNNWVQERGLYFAGEWDSNYQVILSSNDPKEKEMKGGLLYGKYGKGAFIYTGLSFFRELPAGVSGAYRLFVNLIEN